jgi:hypothetical protein
VNPFKRFKEKMRKGGAFLGGSRDIGDIVDIGDIGLEGVLFVERQQIGGDYSLLIHPQSSHFLSSLSSFTVHTFLP